MQFARTVHFQIKDGKKDEFNKVFTDDVLPILRKQDGFREELTLLNPERCLGISLWNDRSSAQRYQDSTYPKVLNRLDPLIKDKPRVETYEVGVSTVSA